MIEKYNNIEELIEEVTFYTDGEDDEDCLQYCENKNWEIEWCDENLEDLVTDLKSIIIEIKTVMRMKELMMEKGE